MAGPVTPNGSILLTIDAGRTLVITGEAGSAGSVALFNGQTVESVDQIAGAQAKTFGPFISNRSVRLYVETGTIDYQFLSSVSALPYPGTPTISDDGKTVSGQGVKPGSAVTIYLLDTGQPLGQTVALLDGSWSVTMKVAQPGNTRIGYEATIIGSYVVTGEVAALSIGGAPNNAAVGTSYSFAPTIRYASGQVTYTLTGSLPAGLSFSASTGAITGMPTTAASVPLKISATDASGAKASLSFTLVVQAASAGGGGSTGGGSTGGGSTGGGSTGGGSTGGGTTTPDPAAQAAAAQATSRRNELTAANSDTGRSGTGAGPFTALTRSVITGKPKVGEQLIGYAALFDASAGISYQWRVNAAVVNGSVTRTYTAAADGDVVEFGTVASDGTVSWSQPVTVFANNPTLQDDTGATITTDAGAPIEIADRTMRWLAPYSASESRLDKFADYDHVPYNYVLTDLDMMVGPARIPVCLYAPGHKLVNIWHSGSIALSLVPDSDGYCFGIVPTTDIKNGPLWMEAHGLANSTDENLVTSGLWAGFDVFVRGAAAPVFPAPAAASGMTLKFADEFETLSSSPGVVPAGGGALTKPDDAVTWFESMAFDPVVGYGDAFFAPRSAAFGPFTIIDGVLRIRCHYEPGLAKSLGDPYDRDYVAGNLTTSFPDSSTNVIPLRNGVYAFSVRCPISIGSWPAVWANDQSALIAKSKGQSSNGREIDFMEQYNQTPGYVATQHRYSSSGDDSTGFHVAGNVGKMGWQRHEIVGYVTDDFIKYYCDDVLVATDDRRYKPPGEADPDLNHVLLSLTMSHDFPKASLPGGNIDFFLDHFRYYAA